NYVILVMTCLPGAPIADRLNSFSEEQVQHLVEQMTKTFDAVRKLQPPNNHVCGIGGRDCVSYLMSFDPFGPFDSVAAFNTWMAHRARSRVDLGKHALPERSDVQATVFSHGDLTPYNVLVDEEGNFTGVIDWECAAWMPAHW
ncbi:hypothetical protein CALVIDRAFT_466602, partial [Calocera viscosa TUFC12733]